MKEILILDIRRETSRLNKEQSFFYSPFSNQKFPQKQARTDEEDEFELV